MVEKTRNDDFLRIAPSKLVDAGCGTHQPVMSKSGRPRCIKPWPFWTSSGWHARVAVKVLVKIWLTNLVRCGSFEAEANVKTLTDQTVVDDIPPNNDVQPKRRHYRESET